MQGRRRSGRQNSCRKDAGLVLEELERSHGHLAWHLLPFVLKKGRGCWPQFSWNTSYPSLLPQLLLWRCLRATGTAEIYTFYGTSLDTHLPLAPLFQGNRNRVMASVKQKAAYFGMTLKELEGINIGNSPSLKRLVWYKKWRHTWFQMQAPAYNWQWELW